MVFCQGLFCLNAICFYQIAAFENYSSSKIYEPTPRVYWPFRTVVGQKPTPWVVIIIPAASARPTLR